jgi:glutamate racemase
MSRLPLQPGFIGVFDSGVGGLTVVRRILENSSHRIVFVADQHHVPYGGRPLEQIRHFAGEISRALINQGASAVIMACNISTATALDEVCREWPGVPVYGVIGPGAEMAVSVTENGKVGVLATLGTVSTGAYTRAIQTLQPSSEVTEVPCPRFVPLIESGMLDGAETEEAVYEALQPLQIAGCDTVVLGCTHYPYLLPVLQRLAPDVKFVDPAITAVSHLLSAVRERHESEPGAGSLLLTTGSLPEFTEQVPVFLPGVGNRVQCDTAKWQGDHLQLTVNSLTAYTP